MPCMFLYLSTPFIFPSLLLLLLLLFLLLELELALVLPSKKSSLIFILDLGVVFFFSSVFGDLHFSTIFWLLLFTWSPRNILLKSYSSSIFIAAKPAFLGCFLLNLVLNL